MKRAASLSFFVEYLERYYFLICFAIYIHTESSALRSTSSFKSSFSDWMKARPELYSILRRYIFIGSVWLFQNYLVRSGIGLCRRGSYQFCLTTWFFQRPSQSSYYNNWSPWSNTNLYHISHITCKSTSLALMILASHSLHSGLAFYNDSSVLFV